jgi:putative transposase
LDPDPCYLALGITTEERQQRYREFVSLGVSKSQIDFLRSAVQRNQLTGSDEFVVEVEQLTGMRISTRGRGRPLLPTTTAIASAGNNQLSFRDEEK